MNKEDYYLSIETPSEGLFKDRGSRFIALAFPVSTEEEAKNRLSRVKKKYHDARHHCYAFRIHPEKEFFRSSDDGEPSGTAGKPILNQIFSHELFNILIVVVRYFGGTKLGVPGLINAYKSATEDAINNANIIKKTITRTITVTYEYPLMNNVMRLIKEEKLNIVEQKFDLSCLLTIETEKSREETIRKKLNSIFGVNVK